MINTSGILIEESGISVGAWTVWWLHDFDRGHGTRSDYINITKNHKKEGCNHPTYGFYPLKRKVLGPNMCQCCIRRPEQAWHSTTKTGLLMNALTSGWFVTLVPWLNGPRIGWFLIFCLSLRVHSSKHQFSLLRGTIINSFDQPLSIIINPEPLKYRYSCGSLPIIIHHEPSLIVTNGAIPCDPKSLLALTIGTQPTFLFRGYNHLFGLKRKVKLWLNPPNKTMMVP